MPEEQNPHPTPVNGPTTVLEPDSPRQSTFTSDFSQTTHPAFAPKPNSVQNQPSSPGAVYSPATEPTPVEVNTPVVPSPAPTPVANPEPLEGPDSSSLEAKSTATLSATPLADPPQNPSPLDAPDTQVDGMEHTAPLTGEPAGPLEPDGNKVGRRSMKTVTIVSSVAIVILLLVIGAVRIIGNRLAENVTTTDPGDFIETSASLEGLLAQQTGQVAVGGENTLLINGELLANGTFVVAPSNQPVDPVLGQIYYDVGTNILYYWNGTEFVDLQSISKIEIDRFELPSTVCLVSNNCNFASASGLSSLAASAFVQNGNSFGAGARLGTNDSNSLTLETNNIDRLTIDATGNVGVGTTSPTSRFEVRWLTGDTSSTAVFGSSDPTNDQAAVVGSSGGNIGVVGNSVSAWGVMGTTTGDSSGGSLSLGSGGVIGNAVNATNSYGVLGLGTIFGSATTNNIGVGAFGSSYGLYASSTNSSAGFFKGGCEGLFGCTPSTAPLVVIQQYSDATTNDFLQAQNASAQQIFKVAYDGKITTGRSSGTNGAIIFNNSTNANTTTLQVVTPTSNRVISLPNEDGTICIQGSASCGFAFGAGGLAFVQDGNSFGAPAILGTNDNNSLSFETNTITRATITNTGDFNILNDLDVGSQLAVGSVASVTANTIANFAETYTNTSGNLTGISAIANLDPGSASSATTGSGYFNTMTQAGNAQNFTGFNYGSNSGVTHNGTGTMDFAFGATGTVNNASTGNIPIAYGVSGVVSNASSGNLTFVSAGVEGQVINSGTGTIANAISLFAPSNANSGGGTITNNYGISVQAQTAGVNDYGIRIDAADTQTLWISGNADNTTASAGIAFGSSRDTNLYRGAANRLNTDDQLDVFGHAAFGANATPNFSNGSNVYHCVLAYCVVSGEANNAVLAIEETFTDLVGTPDSISVGQDNFITLSPSVDSTGAKAYAEHNYITINPASTQPIGFVAGEETAVNVQGSGNINLTYGQGTYVRNNLAGGATVANAVGHFALVAHEGAGTTTNATGGVVSISNSGSGNITNGTGLLIQGGLSAGGNITNLKGIEIQTVGDTGAGSITDNYGISVQAQTAGVNDYGIRIDAADTQTLWLSGNADNTTANAGIAFGASRDTNLYRGAANQLNTDDALDVAGHAAIGATGQVGGGGSDNVVLHVAETVNPSLGGNDYGALIEITTNPSLAGGGVTLGSVSRVQTSDTATQSDGWIVGAQGNASHQSDQNLNIMYGTYGYSSVSALSSGNVTGAAIGAVGQFDHWGSGTVTQASGSIGLAKNGGLGTVTTMYAGLFQASNEGGGNIGTANGILIQNNLSGAGNITDNFGMQIANPTDTGGGAITNNYGLYVQPQTAGTTIDYGVAIGVADTQTLVVGANVDATTANAGIAFGTSRDTNIYRSAVSTLKTDDSFHALGHIALGANSAINDTTLINPSVTYSSVVMVEESATNLAATSNVNGITNYLQLNPSAPATSDVNGVDTHVEIAAGNAQNFTGSIAGNRTSVTKKGSGDVGTMYGNVIGVGVDATSSGDVSAMVGQSIRVVHNGNGTVSSQIGLNIDRAVDSALSDVDASVGLIISNPSGIGAITENYGLYITGQTMGTSDYTAAFGTADTQTLWIGNDADGTTANAGIAFGLSRDTNLYRSGANVLRTDDIFSVGSMGATDTATYLCLNSSNQLAACSGTGSGVAFINGGNSFGAAARLGTNDGFDLEIETNNTLRAVFDDASYNAYFGNGVTNASPTGFTLNATGGSGTDVTGAALTIAGGRGTGNASGGNIVFQVAPNSSTGSSLNPLQTTLNISGASGRLASTGLNTAAAHNVDLITSHAASGVNLNFAASAAGTNYGQVRVFQTGSGSGGRGDLVIGVRNAGSVVDRITISGDDATTINASSSTADTLIVNNGTNTGDILELRDNGTVVQRVADGGATLFRNSVNSLSGFTIQNASSSTLVGVNTFSSQSSLNLVSNPSMEQNANGWTPRGASAVTSDDTQFTFGVRSLKAATTASANDGAKYSFKFAPSQQYSLSLWARLDASSATTINIGRADNGSDIDCLTGQTVNTTWTQFTCTFTTGATIDNAPYFYIKQTDAAARNIFIDGVTLVTGGTAQSYVAPAQSLQIDAQQQNITLNNNNGGEISSWQLNSNGLPAGRYSHGSTVANGYIYVVGGTDSASATQSSVYYAKINADGSTGAWTTSSNPLPAVRSRLGVTSSNGYIYAVGGLDASSPVVTTYYAKLNADGSTSQWIEVPAGNSIPSASSATTTFAANGYLYRVGGSSAASNIYLARINTDGSVGAWTTNPATLPNNRQFTSVVVANGFVYVVAGAQGTTSQTTVYYGRLNPDGTIGAFSTAASVIPGARQKQTALVSNGYLYVIGGGTSTTAATSTVYYAKINTDGSVGTFQTSTNALPSARLSHSSVAANGYIYSIGGSSNFAADAKTEVLYASTARLLVGGSLDLVGLSSTNLADLSGDASTGSMGGSLTAGNTKIIGALEVLGNASFGQNVTVAKDLKVGGGLTVQSSSLNQIGNLGSLGDIEDLWIQGNYLYAVRSGTVDALTVFDVSNPTSPSLISSESLSNNPVDVHVVGKYAYTVSSTGASFQITDISNPADPTVTSTIATSGTPGAAGTVYVSGRYAYVSAGGATIDIFDISNPATPTVVIAGYSISSTLAEFVVQGKYLYSVHGGTPGRLIITDISNPASPVAIGSDITNVANGATALDVEGRYAYIVSDSTSTIETYDVSNPAAPAERDQLALANATMGVAVQGSYAYVAGNGSSYLQAVNVSNASDIYIAASSPTDLPGGVSGDMVVQGRYLYMSHNATNELGVWDLGSAYIQQLEAGGIEASDITVQRGLAVGNTLSVTGGANITGGLNVQGLSSFAHSLNTTAASSISLQGLHLNDTGITTTGTDANTGQVIAVSRSGATGGTLSSIGQNIVLNDSSITTTGTNANAAQVLNINRTGNNGGTDTNYGQVINVTGTVTSGSTTNYGVRAGVIGDTTGTSVSYGVYGSSGSTIAGASTLSDSNYGGYFTSHGLYTTSPTIGSAVGVQGNVTLTAVSSPTLVDAYAVRGSVVAGNFGGAATITNAHGLYIDSAVATGGAILTTNYGALIKAQTVGATDYGLAIEAADTQTLWIGSATDSTTAAAGIAFGSSRDTNLYRSAANVLKTDDSLDVATKAQVGSGGGTLDQCATVLGLGTCYAAFEVTGTSTETTAGTRGSNLLVSITPSSTNSAANYGNSNTLVLLGTQSYSGAQNAAVGGDGINGTTAGTVTQLTGVVGTANQAGAGSTVTTATGLYGGVTRTNGTLTTAQGLRIAAASGTITDNYGIIVDAQTAATNDYGVAIGAADTQTLWIGNTADSTTAAAGIAFGSSRDTNLYRSAANSLRTDDSFLVQGTISSSPGTGSNSERFGASTTAAGSGSLAIGASASTASFNSSLAIGNSAVVTANDGFSVGRQATSSQASQAIGNESSAAGGSSIAIGFQANTAHTASIAIGRTATSTAANQFVVGGTDGSITSAYFGKGVTHSAPSAFTLQTTGGSGTDIAGAALLIAGGRGTGTGNGGDISLQIADPGSTGASLNALGTVMNLSGINGAAYFQNTTDSTTGFKVMDADGGTSVFNINTTDERVGIGTDAPGYKLDAADDRASSYVANFFNDGNDANRYGIQVQAGADDGTGTTYYLNALDGDGNQVGYLANDAGTFAVTDISDARTKTNIMNTTADGLSIINGLRVTDYNRLSNPDGPIITGFIAQEVQGVYDQAVTIGEDGMLGIRKDAFIPILVKSVQEIDSKVTSLESRVAGLEASQAAADASSSSSTPQESTNSTIFREDHVSLGVQEISIPAGNGPYTLAVTSSYVEINCADPAGCDVTLDTAGASRGTFVFIFSVGTGAVTFADTPGVAELAGNFVAEAYDSLSLMYLGDRWSELGRSDN